MVSILTLRRRRSVTSHWRVPSHQYAYLIGVPDAMRAARYTTDESKDKTLQVQVRREVERIKRDNVDPAPMLVIGVGCRLYLVTETVRYRENIATLEAELGMSSLLSCDVIIVVVFVFFVLLFNR